jgi:Flp pilus assembly protein TadG
MRVTALRRVHREDSGAVLMIVAVTMLVLVGMLVLTVDLGRAVAIKREMVAGTDAGALAAAQQCALGSTTTQAQAAANDALGKNKSGATVTSFSAPGCGLAAPSLRYVTVRSTVDVDYFFAGIFGFDSGPVVSQAVVEWGALQSGFPVPVTVDNAQLTSCGIAPNNPPDSDVNCNLTYPKDQFTNPRWGVLDLSKWGNPAGGKCPVPASTVKGLIDGGGTPNILQAPAYDCLDNGLSDTVWKALEGKILYFPVNDLNKSTGTIKNNPNKGKPCTGAQIPALKAAGNDCVIDHAYIIGWIQLRVNVVGKHGPDVFLDVTYLGFTTGGGLPGNGVTDFGSHAFRLVD